MKLEIGQKTNSLQLIELRGKSKHNKPIGLFKCDCGVEKEMLIGNVQNGRSTSCGCYRKKLVAESKPGTKHGFGHSPLYDVWHLMNRRCYEVAGKNYHQYGALGVTVCDEWRNDVAAFAKWALSNGYEKGLQLDRIDTFGNYEPSNCRFVTSKVNNNNRKDNRLLECRGVTKTLQQWADEYGIKREFISYCLRKGWPIEKILQ